MNHLTLFENFDEQIIKLIHTTTNDIARMIEVDGFIPKPFLDYAYYSELGKEGIYFYSVRDTRNIQTYGYFLKQKAKVDSLALVYVIVPSSCVRAGDKIQDGLFVSGEDLSRIQIEHIRYNIQPSSLY